MPKDTFPTIKLKGSECAILTVLGTHLNKHSKENKKKVLLKPWQLDNCMLWLSCRKGKDKQ